MAYRKQGEWCGMLGWHYLLNKVHVWGVGGDINKEISRKREDNMKNCKG